MRLIRHPLVKRDLLELVDHIVESTQGDVAAASRRLDEIDALLAEIAANPGSGMRLAAPLDGWLVRHGGRGRFRRARLDVWQCWTKNLRK